MEKSIVVNVTVNLNGDVQSVTSKTINEGENCSNSYTENPFNYLGVLHNEYLESSKDFKGSLDEIITHSKDFFNKKLNQEIPEIKKIVEIAINSSMSEIFNEENGFTTNSCSYLNELNNIMFKPNVLRIPSIIKNIKKLESRAINNLNKKDQEVVLTTLAIAINSLEYWDNFPYEEDNQPAKLRPFWKKFWKVVGIAAADIGAGALGSLINPIVGGAAAGAASKGAS